MIKTFTVLTDGVDSQGDRIILSGIKKPESVFILDNFDQSKPIGKSKNIINNGSELIVTADLPENTKGMYPAIGFQMLKSEIINGVREIQECKLFCVGLSASPNVDPNIPPID